jgi:hypothetical protein
LTAAAQHVVTVADAALVPVVGRELERQQLLLLHGAARVVPEAVEELGLPLSKLRVLPPPRRRPLQRRGVVAEVTTEAAIAATSVPD